MDETPQNYWLQNIKNKMAKLKVLTIQKQVIKKSFLLIFYFWQKLFSWAWVWVPV